ncbi:helix-turn-helix domain-containing protein [Candidatus Mycobacterium wuenschmannii]|uniref:Helix-turn-helix domain-containing protein n=1 Tax=Candidatus Mycobacterium wuenschmannii TaxID=3027808 RepID=A0ABY8VUS2_9MYCO|nr:helix-turn-helix domain-containing protein [Candidatus Mycobacterium wuenschmannii]WIM87394.1 helix-turn-helix domain-containing protein [Candidatus Mycobacterium wuenschmannii]
MGYWQTTDVRTGLVLWCSSGAGVLRVLPDLHADLMFWRGGLHIAGYDTRAHDYDRGDGDTTYGVRLPPGALAPVLRDSALHAVDERIALAPRRGDLLSIATRLLADADVETRCATAVLAQARAGTRVAGVAAELGWSARRLHRFCHNNFGMPFATLRGLYRFRFAHDLLSDGLCPADVAARTGYADQSHLTREVGRFAMTTPARIHASTVASGTSAGLE